VEEALESTAPEKHKTSREMSLEPKQKRPFSTLVRQDANRPVNPPKKGKKKKEKMSCPVCLFFQSYL
jgi:hypothetical protein